MALKTKPGLSKRKHWHRCIIDIVFALKHVGTERFVTETYNADIEIHNLPVFQIV